VRGDDGRLSEMMPVHALSARRRGHTTRRDLIGGGEGHGGEVGYTRTASATPHPVPLPLDDSSACLNLTKRGRGEQAASVRREKHEHRAFSTDRSMVGLVTSE